jgi:hypothetical protein
MNKMRGGYALAAKLKLVMLCCVWTFRVSGASVLGASSRRR